MTSLQKPAGKLVMNPSKPKPRPQSKVLTFNLPRIHKTDTACCWRCHLPQRAGRLSAEPVAPVSYVLAAGRLQRAPAPVQAEAEESCWQRAGLCPGDKCGQAAC